MEESEGRMSQRVISAGINSGQTRKLSEPDLRRTVNSEKINIIEKAAWGVRKKGGSVGGSLEL